ncbi:25888_t:CDS:2 [Gigaspora rosea]|nr:25888_t:CDS:2 [Gigaspora rosea]
MGYAKKALDLAIQADRVEEFVSQLKTFIAVTTHDLLSTQDSTSIITVEDPLHVPHKGTELSHDEIQEATEAFDDNASEEKKVRRCQKCKQVGHYAPTCPNINE